ncbi:MAG: MerR family transcriptional regulator [Streptosporangiaceae bacterium]|jgi:DNA-binding transcriptional MerR regulator/mannose-6-phosphate isomerase-like protein (cupin superfamily)
MSEAVAADATEQLAPRLSIGEISRLTNVSPSTLRDWENYGIVRPLRQGTRRRYSLADVERVRTASQLRRKSFSPAAIAATLEPGQPGAANQSVEMGRILRQARLDRGSSLREVASAVNISVSHLSTVERGGVQPGLALLQRLAEVYSMDVADLFGGPALSSPDVRKWSDSEILLSDGDRVRVRAIARSGVICSDMYEADPGGGSGGSYEHDGDECVLVLEGTAEFVFGDASTKTLTAGESVSFNSRIPHRWTNGGAGLLKMIWTNARPAPQPPPDS